MLTCCVQAMRLLIASSLNVLGSEAPLWQSACWDIIALSLQLSCEYSPASKRWKSATHSLSSTATPGWARRSISPTSRTATAVTCKQVHNVKSVSGHQATCIVSLGCSTQMRAADLCTHVRNMTAWACANCQAPPAGPRHTYHIML